MRLNKKEIENKLRQLQNWQLQGKAIGAEFQFSDFPEAIRFVNRVADVAEALNHHPDICIYYNRVVISVYTHSEDGITEKDFTLAEQINQLLQQ